MSTYRLTTMLSLVVTLWRSLRAGGSGIITFRGLAWYDTAQFSVFTVKGQVKYLRIKI